MKIGRIIFALRDAKSHVCRNPSCEEVSRAAKGRIADSLAYVFAVGEFIRGSHSIAKAVSFVVAGAAE